MVLDLAEVLGAEQFLRAEDLRALLQGLLGEGELVGEVPFRILTTRHLAETYFDDRRSGHPAIVTATCPVASPTGTRCWSWSCSSSTTTAPSPRPPTAASARGAARRRG